MTAADIDSIREQLKEARRYAESDPEICCRMLLEAVTKRMQNLTKMSHDEHRIFNNLTVARHALLVDPDVAKGYIYGVVYELGCLRSELEKAESREASL